MNNNLDFMNQLKNKFQTFGYIKKKILNKKHKDEIINIIYELFEPYIKFKKKNIESLDFHQKIINFKRLHPKKFSEIYDKFKLNAKLRSIFYDKKILNLFAKILGGSSNNLYLNGFMFRMDIPFDKKHTLKWHQDAYYYPMSSKRNNLAGICWIPITKVNKKNGTLIYIPKSHKQIIKTKPTKLKKLKTQQRKIPISSKENLNKKSVNLNSGDAFLFDLKLKHKSGFNTSKKVRLVIGCGFHLMEKKFIVGQERYKLNSYR
jgi:ectoine hydroxylase-related dioxygenase (phytanoyl-CoA dioxygenase family)